MNKLEMSESIMAAKTMAGMGLGGDREKNVALATVYLTPPASA